MYDPVSALAGIDGNITAIFIALLIVVVAVFVYWSQAVRIANRDQVYVIPFIGIAVFFWHDLTFVLSYDKWFNVYDHWWLKMWWYALVPCVIFESLFIYHFIKWGRKDWFQNLSQRQFAVLSLLATLGVGGFWYLFKTAMDDELFFVTFAITAVWSVPFHTGVMARRQSRKGQSVAMEVAAIVMIICLSYAFSFASDVFVSPTYLCFVAISIFWALTNIYLMKMLPEESPVRV